MWHPIVINALVSGLFIAAVAAPFGCFLVWKRIASFSDAVSHIALPGIAAGTLLGISSVWCSAAVIFAMSVVVSRIKERGRTSANSVLVALAQVGLGVGYLLLSLFDGSDRLNAILFGDILSLDAVDVAVIVLLSTFAAVSLFVIREKLLLSVLCEDIAVTEGINVRRLNLFFMFLLSLIVAVAIKTVGVLLISSLLIVPAVVARSLAQNYRQMTVFAVLIGVLSVGIGVFTSFLFDVPPVAAIVSLLGFFGAVIFLMQIVIKYFKKSF